MDKKVCKKCNKEKEISCFYKDKGLKDGYKSTCKECNNKTHKGICVHCNSEFVSSKKNQQYCSVKCLTSSQKKRVLLKCDYCNKSYEVVECNYKNKKHHYCSKECRCKHHSDLIKGDLNPRYNSNTVKCDMCGKDITRRESQIRDRNFCNHDCYAYYRKTHYVKENHSSWCGGEIEVRCSNCGISILRKKSEIRDNNYCSVECMGKDRTRLYSSENNNNWQGGITKISEYLRHNINEWKMDSFKKYNFKCDITGECESLVIHHLYNYSDIIKEVFETLKLPIYECINKYTDEELEMLKATCVSIHYKYGLGVCLTEGVHIEFHSIYGKKNNTVEQYNEFKIKNNNSDKERLIP